MTELNEAAFAFDPDLGPPHDRPSAQQLVEAVRVWIETELSADLDGRLKFHARVATNMLAMVERELELGPEQSVSHSERLRAFGVADERELARRIADGEFDDRTAELKAMLRSTVEEKLQVANPTYLD